jgi:aldehyde dehydrogenase (NAD+)
VPRWEKTDSDASDEAAGVSNDGAKSENARNAGSEPDIAEREVELVRGPLTESADESLKPGIDRSPKLYIGGKQVRPDSGYSFAVKDGSGKYCGEVGLGNRKDIRNAVEAANKAASWSQATAHLRAQILYYLAENLATRAGEFKERLAMSPGHSRELAEREITKAIERLFYYAAWADKYDGRVHPVPFRNVTLAMPEPWGVLGIVCPPEQPLLSFISLVAPTLALGNRLIVIPSWRYPLVVTDFYQVLDTSDVPGGVVNLVTGDANELGRVLAQHDDVAALWCVGSKALSEQIERDSSGNLKSTWVNFGKTRDWFDDRQGQGKEYLRRATQIKNIWVPYGE